MDEQLINPFVDNIGIQVDSVDNYGSTSLQNLSDFQIGAGNQALKGDSSGLWLGADKFKDAPFSVDMNGNIVASTLALSAYLSKTDTSQALSGSINVGGNSVIIDGVNGRILMNDGSNNRMVIGNV